VTRLRVLLARLLGTLTGRRREDDLREELETHLELLADDHRRRGLSDAEARLAARRELGGVAQTREAFRDTRVLPGIDALRQDLRFAWRALMRDRGTTLAAIALLTIGVSSTVVLADVLDRLLLRPPTHVDDPSRVRRIYSSLVKGDGRPGLLTTNYATMRHVADGIRQDIEALATYEHERIGSGRGPDATRFETIAFSEAYFDVLGITPAIGVLPSVRRPPNLEAVVISHALWQTRFGSATDIIGRPVRLGQRTHTVVAVGPRGFAGIDDDPVDLWVPLESRRRDKEWRTGNYYFGLRALVRLRPGVDRARVEAHASQVFNVAQRVDRPAGLEQDARLLFGPLPPGQAPASSQQTQVLMAVAAVSVLVLLMACGNVANLLVLTGLRRTSELTLKAALGAGRGRLLREVFLQAVLLSAAAGAGALVLVLTLGVLVRRTFLPPLAATLVTLDGRLAVLTVLTCAAVALVLGVAPAIRLTSVRTLVPGRVRLGTAPSRLLDSFVAFQVALSVPLLVGTLLFAVSFWHIAHVDLGVDLRRVVVVKADMIDDGRPSEQHAVHRRMQEQLATLPGIAATALSQTTPMHGGLGLMFEVPGFSWSVGRQSVPMINAVDPAFLDVMGMRIVQGRGFSEADNRPGAPTVAVVNETMARKYWSGTSPVGRCILIASRPCTVVIGVVAKASPFASLRGEWSDADGQFFVPIEAFKDLNDQRVLLVRTEGDPRAILSRLRSEAQMARADLPYVDAFPLDDVFEFQVKPLRLGWSIFLALSALALAISVAGLAVVTAHGVTRRTREMGIRSRARRSAGRPRAIDGTADTGRDGDRPRGRRRPGLRRRGAPEDRALRHRARRSTHLCRGGGGPLPRRRHRRLDPRSPYRSHRAVGGVANRVTKAQGSRFLATVSAASAIARHSGENSQVSQERNGSSPSDLKKPT
jgi:predicted permease